MSNPVELWFRVSGPPTAPEVVLDLLIRNADDQFTEPQVRAELALPRSTVSVALAALVRQGVVQVTRVGRSGLYSASTKDPLIRQLKVARAVRSVQAALAPVAEHIELAILFGSASRGEDHAGSDVDVLIVTSETDRVSDTVAGFLWMQPILMPSSRHMALLAENTTLANETAKGIRVLERR
jgi:predicted nucleotidyltransferase